MDLSSYPIKYIRPVQLSDGTFVQLRPIHPLDGQQAHQFKDSLSIESIYNRFFGYIPKVSEKLIKRLTSINYEKEMAIIAETIDEEKEVIAVARIAPDRNQSAEFALIISDRWQGKKLGTILTSYMIEIAQDLGFSSVYALVLSHNTGMLEILRRQHFRLQVEDESSIRADLDLIKNRRVK
ncbi:MAG: GNAT family N-acetyltransferase [Bacteroidota bacterium]